MFWRNSGYQDRTASGYFGQCDECDLPIQSANSDGPRETWLPVDYVVRTFRTFRSFGIHKYHPLCALAARRRDGA